MRNVVLWIGMSLDGFTSGVNEQLDWLVPHATRPQSEPIFRRLRERCDTVLMGRVNYEGFLGYWPKVKDDPKASPNDVEISRCWKMCRRWSSRARCVR
jgi:dihydrofolate reductase